MARARPRGSNRGRWERVFNLRRRLIPYILLAGQRPPQPGEDGPQPFVCLSDDFDDVLEQALEKEALIATGKLTPEGKRKGARRAL